jgi:hypothetical protein
MVGGRIVYYHCGHSSGGVGEDGFRKVETVDFGENVGQNSSLIEVRVQPTYILSIFSFAN